MIIRFREGITHHCSGLGTRLQALVIICLFAGISSAAEPGVFGGSLFGPPLNSPVALLASAGGPTTLVMNSTNNAWAHRFLAYTTRDIYTVYVNFSEVSSPGTVTARIETIDGSTGKPTGTLYDANATKQFTPSAGWNTVTFDTPPSTGMTVGSSYAIVLIKDNNGTTCTLNARVTGAEFPAAVLTASDGSTRSNFAEVSNNAGVCFVAYEDGDIESVGSCGAASAPIAPLYGADIVVAQKIVVPQEMVVRGISCSGSCFLRIGTPAGDVRVRILNSSNSAVSGTTFTLDKDELTNSNGRRLCVPLNNVTLAAGTYRIAFDSSGSATSSHCFALRYCILGDAALQSSSFCYSGSSNASSTFTWSDTTTQQLSIGLEIDSISASGSSVAIDPIISQ